MQVDITEIGEVQRTLFARDENGQPGKKPVFQVIIQREDHEAPVIDLSQLRGVNIWEYKHEGTHGNTTVFSVVTDTPLALHSAILNPNHF